MRRRQESSVQQPASLQEVMAEERQCIRRTRRLRKQPDEVDQLVGLAFSGGGIRSATFNLGVLQGLAELQLLPKFDYLSTVSGGGYIGSWLIAWLQRQKDMQTIQAQLAPNHARNGARDEPPPLTFLRRFSNYLTPRVGLFSADTWTFVATYLRNLLLNLPILVAALIAVLLVPRLLGSLTQWLQHHPTLLLTGTLIFLATSIEFIRRNLARLAAATALSQTATYPAFTRPPAVHGTVIFPLFMAAWLGSVWLSMHTRNLVWWHWLLGTGVVYVVPWLCGLIRHRNKENAAWVLSAFISGSTGGLFLWGLASLFTAWTDSLATPWYVLSLGIPLLLCVFSTIAILHIGLLGRRLSNETLEWWSRLGGWLTLYMLGWVALFGVALYSPPLLGWAQRWVKASLSVGWILSTVAGVLAGKSSKTGSHEANPWLEIIARFAPYIFIVGLLAALSLGIHTALASLEGEAPASMAPKPSSLPAVSMQVHANIGDHTVTIQGALPAPDTPFATRLAQHWQMTTATLRPRLWLCFGLSVAIMLILSYRVDINEFSLHLLYRNRLTRAYLGASNPAPRPHPFTGFDPRDDLPLHQLAEAQYPGPYPIMNTALNLVGGDELAWQERKAVSFVFTPRFCGYQIEKPPASAGAVAPPLAAYRPTPAYGNGVSLGTAVAISGAAASPNMGYHSSPALAFLMTVFNVRLGWWLGNPRHPEAWKNPGPRFGLFYLLLELLGQSNDRSRYVYLSDGGHFENLGLYELVRRRCRYIVVSDASQDGALAFEDLGNAIRKCRVDLGIEIDLDVDPIRQRGDQHHSLRQCAVGRIHYERVEAQATPGILVYLKPALTGAEPTDILNYAARQPEFPHQTTADQWFDESQFESYRQLGYYIVKKTFTSATETPGALDNEALFVALRQWWYPPSAVAPGAFTRHGATLDNLFTQLRRDEKLRFLDRQFYPAWGHLTKDATPPQQPEFWLPDDQEAIRQGFYFCNSLIQLMENVYLDLHLELEYDHPDNRGWMNLFSHWSWSGMFRLTWAMSASTYGTRFQRFCERYLRLTIGDIAIQALPLPEPCTADSLAALLQQAQRDLELNFLEASLIARFHQEYPAAVRCIYLLRIVVSNPLDPGRSLRFPFGFALTDGNHHLVYFRVQDHVRKMGLARQALTELVRVYHLEAAQLLAMPQDALEVPTSADQEQFVRLLQSVKYATDLRQAN